VIFLFVTLWGKKQQQQQNNKPQTSEELFVLLEKQT